MELLGGFGTPAPNGVSAKAYPDDYAVAPLLNNAGKDIDRKEIDEIPGEDRRWSWVEIDLGAIAHNTSVARHALSSSARLMAVVKADAYGHGSVRVARTALQCCR